MKSNVYNEYVYVLNKEIKKGGCIVTNLMQRAKYVIKGEDGASNVEIIVWFSVVLVISTALFLFRNQVTDFISDAGEQVDALGVKGEGEPGAGVR